MLAQVLAIIIFLAMFLLIILEIWERQWITPGVRSSDPASGLWAWYAQHGGDHAYPEFTEFLYNRILVCSR